MQTLTKFSRLILIGIVLTACDESTDPPVEGNIYFPPPNTTTWETTEPSALGFDESSLHDLRSFLQENNSRAFILLKDGKIVIEEYMGKQLIGDSDFSAASNWYWASAGKTLTSALIGIASGEGLIGLDDKSSAYLGEGWSSLTVEQENEILIRHHLTMTTGLDDNVQNPDCTDKACLLYRAAPGSYWAYHNGPYTILDKAISNATGKNLNEYVEQKVKSKTGMDGQYIKTGDNNVFYSTARSMARFGLLLLNKGMWDNEQVIPEHYFGLMTTSSQQINPSYGYLTWLNGKSSYMIPKTQAVFTGFVSPNAPADLFAAMGKNGQLINVVPSLNIVVIRMGDAPGTSLVPYTFQDDLWAKLSPIIDD